VPIPGVTATTGWRVCRTVGQAGPFHARIVARPAEAELWTHRVTRPAVVLGSAQPATLIDHAEAARAGVEVTRRRSGGGLVLVHPDHSRWVDIVLPRAHPWWDDDVGRASHWVGDAWAEAVRPALVEPVTEPTVHRGGLRRTRWGALLCFAGLGPGEVSVGGAKVVGISQRRTRDWARFQCLVLADPDTELLARVVAPHALPGPEEELHDLPMGHPVDLDAAVDRFERSVVDT
jgi:lipoate---protein ligase